jgi:hypothetical protein
VYFASDRSPGREGHSKQLLEDGLQRAIAFTTADAKAKTIGVQLVRLCFYGGARGYEISDVQYADDSSIVLIQPLRR